MTTVLSLASLEEGLRQPFRPEDIQFLPRSITKHDHQWTCLALPYADQHLYEERLNQLAFGHWSTPPSIPVVAGTTLIIPVTVIMCGVVHTAYGEVSLNSRPDQEERQEMTTAYSHAFRRACARFGLGCYLSALPACWLPYDPKERCIVLTEEERLVWVHRLYQHAGLSLAHQRSTPNPSASPLVPPNTGTEGACDASASLQASSHGGDHMEEPSPVTLISPRELTWIRRYVKNEAKICSLCAEYGVSQLEHLTSQQAIHLINRMLAALKQRGTPSSSPAQRSAEKTRKEF